MRALSGGLLIAAAVVFVLADARGQMSFSTGFTPQNIQYVPIVPGMQILKPPTTKATPQPVSTKPFGLNSVFPRISFGNWPSGFPNLSLLPSSTPTQPLTQVPLQVPAKQ